MRVENSNGLTCFSQDVESSMTGILSTYRVTMSALAASTAMDSGVLPSVSTALCLAPLFRNRHTWLKECETITLGTMSFIYRQVVITGKGHTQQNYICTALQPSPWYNIALVHFDSQQDDTDISVEWMNSMPRDTYDDTYPVWPRIVAWCSGPRPRISCWSTLPAFWRRNSQVTSEPCGMKHHIYIHTYIDTDSTQRHRLMITKQQDCIQSF